MLAGPRLQRALPRCTLRVLPGRSHAALQEYGVNLLQVRWGGLQARGLDLST